MVGFPASCTTLMLNYCVKIGRVEEALKPLDDFRGGQTIPVLQERSGSDKVLFN